VSLNLVQAGELVGRSKSAILKAIRRGDISASRDAVTNAWLIEPAELTRVYQPRTSAEKDEAGNRNSALETVLLAEVRARLAEVQSVVRDLQQRLTESDRERTRLTVLLTDQRSSSRRGPWSWPWPTRRSLRG
jgi:hypothetical protein